MQRFSKLLPLFLLFASSLSLASATGTREVLVLTTATTITIADTTRSVDVQNNGPNNIWCALNATPVLNKSHKVASGGGSWTLPVSKGMTLKCLASADQLTGAATNVTESSQP